MKTILITDTHFGTRQNSNTWLNSQINFLENQLIPYIKNNGDIRLVHLGDVFDSRSTISTMVATKVVEVFKKISGLVKEFIIIGGNHDFYSPNSDEVDTLNLLLGSLNIKIVTKNILIDKEAKHLYVPWYQWIESTQAIQDLIDTYGIIRVFTHADIIHEPVNIRCLEIYSGHIHIPGLKGGLRNLGSTYALDFADANSRRGFYVIHEDGQLVFIENEKSIKFHRLYNSDIFTVPDWDKNDYIEMYISQSNLADAFYIDEINHIIKTWKNVWLIPQTESNDLQISESQDKFEGYDIETIVSKLIPENLKDKFEQVLSVCKS